MTWPTDTLTTDHLDDPADDPALARDEIYNTTLSLKAVLAEASPGSTLVTSANLTSWNIAFLNLENTFTQRQRVERAGQCLFLNRTTTDGAHIVGEVAGAIQGYIGFQTVYALNVWNGAASPVLQVAQDAQLLRVQSTNVEFGGVPLATTNDLSGGSTSTGTNQTATGTWAAYYTIPCSLSGTVIVAGSVTWDSNGLEFGNLKVRIRRGTTTIGEEFIDGGGEGFTGRGTIGFMVRDTGADGSGYQVQIMSGNTSPALPVAGRALFGCGETRSG